MRYLLLFFVWATTAGANELDEHLAKLSAEKFDEVKIFLDTNYVKYQKDPEYYVLLLNYSFLKSRTAGVVVSTEEPKEKGLGQQKNDQVLGVLGERVSFDENVLMDGILKTQSALVYFPNRLDIHLGITYIAKEASLWEVVGHQSVAVLETSKLNSNEWLWGNVNKFEGDPRDFMLQNIASNSATLFRAEDDSADSALVNISNSLIANYPNEVYGYSNLGVLASVNKDYESATRFFHAALELSPNDEVVLQNLKNVESRLKEIDRKAAATP